MINLPFSFLRGIDVLITILAISVALCFIRLYLGPTISNRIIAFDCISIHVVGIIALFAMRIGAPSILDATIIVAVLGFLGTALQARYLERTAPLYYAITRSRDAVVDEVTRKVTPIEREGSKAS